MASLRLRLAATGLATSTAGDGAILARDPASGQVVFQAPPPVMWDSNTAAGPAGLGSVVTGGGGASSAAGPGGAAVITAVPDALSGTALTLAPPKAALSGATVAYPLYLDPTFGPAAYQDAYVESFHTTTTAFNPTDDLKTGYDDWPGYGWENGITRSFLGYHVSQIDNKYIVSADLDLTEVASSNQSTTTYYEVDVSDTSPFSSTLDWANQPGYGAKTDKADIPGVAAGTTHAYQIDITDMINYGVETNGWSSIFMVMHNGDEQNDLKYKHWGLDPALSVTYWSTPNTPTNLSEINGTASTACNTTSPGSWIPAASGNSITLFDDVSTADVGFDLTNNDYVAVNGSSTYTNHATTISAVSGNNPVNTALAVTSGDSYAWHATASNAYETSAASATCYFRYDGTLPTISASSTDFPAAGPTDVTGTGSGTITITGSDPGTNASGLASSFNYNLNGTSISSGGLGEKSVTQSGGTASVSFTLSQVHWGTNTLWLQARDNAGNVSAAYAYDFYVQQSAYGTYTPGTPGDVDGDGNPDLTTIDAAGNILLFAQPDQSNDNVVDITANPPKYGGAPAIGWKQNALYPGATFAGALVTHAGSFIGKNADDLLVKEDSYLDVAENSNANATSFSLVGVQRPACNPEPCSGAWANYSDADWSEVNQMIAIAPASGDGRPDLLTVEYHNGSSYLWLYTPVATGVPAFNLPTLISSDVNGWQWSQNQLIAAAPLGLTGDTLLLRDIGTGNLNTIANITQPISGTPQVTTIGTGFTTAANPLLAASAEVDSSNNWPLWATDSAGHLAVFSVTSSNGTTTLDNGGAAANLTNSGWASYETALGSMYPGYNNYGITSSGSTGSVFDTATSNGYGYDAAAMAAATPAAGVMSSCPWTSCVSGVAGGYQLSYGNDTFNLPPVNFNVKSADNYLAAGQVLPAPMTGSGTYASTISFLGAGVTDDFTNGVTVNATVTFTDGHTQTVAISFSDWTDTTPISADTALVSAGERIKASDGTVQADNTSLFATTDTTLLDNGQPLSATQAQIASITLPTANTIHIFAIAVY